MEIRNDKDLRDAYWRISFCKQTMREFSTVAPHVEKLIISDKQAIRAYFRREAQKQGRRCIKSDFESYIELIELPETIQSEEDAAEYFEDYEYIHYRNTPYDCTGQLFTNWYKIIKRRGRYMAYHAVSMDI